MFPKILAVRHHRHASLDFSVPFVSWTPRGCKQKADPAPLFSPLRFGAIILDGFVNRRYENDHVVAGTLSGAL